MSVTTNAGNGLPMLVVTHLKLLPCNINIRNFPVCMTGVQ